LLYKLELLRSELSGPNPTPVEKVLVERAIVCWLQVTAADIRLEQSEEPMTVAVAEYHQRCRDRSHRRFLSAIRTLATVRRLAVPALVQQFNTAQMQQVNVVAAGGATSAPRR
jgi:hypothetical protein